jgi:UDP-glucose 4-epimerase
VLVFELIYAFQKLISRCTTFQIVERRSGDLDQYWVNIYKADLLSGWKALGCIHSICSDALSLYFLGKDKSCGT